jgi:hypothetical protein
MRVADLAAENQNCNGSLPAWADMLFVTNALKCYKAHVHLRPGSRDMPGLPWYFY